MNGDFTRSTFRTYKHYTSVRMQQGRVQLDADWNEAEDIRAHLERTTTRDAIGLNGVPKKAAGYAIGLAPDGADLTIAAGRMYVEGVLCELDAEPVPVAELHEDRVVLASLMADGRELDAPQWIELSDATEAKVVRTRIDSVDVAARTLFVKPPLATADVQALGVATLRRAVTYATQPDLPGAQHLSASTPPLLELPDGAYLAYADVWERHVTALDDPDLRESALGGPDTATRTKTVCQVRLEQLDDAAVAHCADTPDVVALLGAHQARNASTGRMRARATPEGPITNPCDLPAGAGYRRLENQLYRVEVHTPGALGTATFKWSRDNASMTARWLGQVGSKLQVSSAGPDDVLGFASGQVVELIDDTRELSASPGTLVRLVAPPEGNVLSADPTVAIDLSAFPLNPKIRRWDCAQETSTTATTTADGWIALEEGVEVRFDDGWYNTGDYWLIPARTAIGDVEWPRDAGTQPVPRYADGIRHRYAKLALLRVTKGAIALVEDCRDQFPALTDLAAVDVTYDNTTCALPGASTVQDALERLCEESTLRRHKKHLHGWGIVCGLQVECGGEERGSRRSVKVLDGYAIDAEGNDLLQEGTKQLDIVQMIGDEQARTDHAMLSDGNGEVSLFMRLDPDRGDVRFEIEPYDARSENQAQSLLAGTLLMDFYTECILPIEVFLRGELQPRAEAQPLMREPTTLLRRPARVSLAQQRQAVLTGLIAHFLNQKTGQLIYVSADEDRILRDFYEGLRKVLNDETFCALFDNARPFPDYPLAEVPMSTIFGLGHHTRIRVRPGKQEAYTVGGGLNPKGPAAVINRYDLKQGVMTGSIDPIGGGEAAAKTKHGTDAVRDVAFSPDGKRIYMIAPTRNGADTLFRSGVIEGDGVRWGSLETICGVRLVTLATTRADANAVYAMAVGRGVFRIQPEAVNASPDPHVAIDNATGQLVVNDDGRAFALAASSDKGGRYDQLVVMQLPSQNKVVKDLGAEGQDGLAMAIESTRTKRNAVFVAIGTGAREVRAYDFAGDPLFDDNKQPVVIPVGEGPVGLDVFAPTGMVLVALEDAYRVQMIDVSTLEPAGFLPVQVGPTSIATDARAAYVLNTVSNTITTIDARMLTAKTRFPFEQLAEYRTGILDAFVDLTGGFVQYLKDCLCDHFLVRCPEPEGDEKIYLAAISMRANQVYKVCNFSKRRYVKSFPTVGYWMSIVPIAPLIDKLVETVCCAILPDRFGMFAARPFDAATMDDMSGQRFRASALRTGAFAFQEWDPSAKFAELMLRLRTLVTQLMSSFGSHAFDAPPPPPKPQFAGQLVGSQSAAVASELAKDGVGVSTKAFNPRTDLKLTDIVRAAMLTPKPGDQVVLLEDAGVVKGVSVVPGGRGVTDPIAQSAPGTQPGPVTQPVTSPMTQPAEQPTSHDVLTLTKRLDAREAEIAALHGRLADMEAKHAELARSIGGGTVATVAKKAATKKAVTKPAMKATTSKASTPQKRATAKRISRPK